MAKISIFKTIALIGVFLLPSCVSIPTAIESFGALVGAINDFWEISIKVQNLVSNATQKTEDELSKVKRNESTIKNVSNLWNEEWGKVGSEIISLTNKLREVDNQATSAFAKLENIAKGYSDPLRREERLRDVDRLKLQYIQQYKSAFLALESTKEMYKIGDDLGRDFTFEAVKDEVESKISDLKNIEDQFKSIQNRILAFKEWADLLSENNISPPVHNKQGPLISPGIKPDAQGIEKDILNCKFMNVEWNNCKSEKENGLITNSVVSFGYFSNKVIGEGIIKGNNRDGKLYNLPIEIEIEISKDGSVKGFIDRVNNKKEKIANAGINLTGKAVSDGNIIRMSGLSNNCGEYQIEFTPE